MIGSGMPINHSSAPRPKPIGLFQSIPRKKRHYHLISSHWTSSKFRPLASPS
jgi:hypothetical protein